MVGCDHQVLKVLQEANVSRQCGQVVVTEVQVAQLAAVEELSGYLLNLVVVQVEALEVGQIANLHRDVGNNCGYTTV